MAINEEDDVTNIPRKLSYISATSEDQTNAAGKAAILALDTINNTSPNNDNSVTTTDKIPPFSIGKIYKNLILLSLAFVILFTAYNGIATLQSSLNVKNNVGVNSLIITYSFLIVSFF